MNDNVVSAERLEQLRQEKRRREEQARAGTILTINYEDEQPSAPASPAPMQTKEPVR